MNNNEDFNYLCRNTLDARTMSLKSIKSHLKKKNSIHISHFVHLKIYILFKSFKNILKF